jgi:hypothetical protein
MMWDWIHSIIQDRDMWESLLNTLTRALISLKTQGIFFVHIDLGFTPHCNQINCNRARLLRD